MDNEIKQPVNEQAQPYAEQEQPVNEQAQPYAEQEQPVNEQAQPYAEQEQPVYEQAQPYAEQEQPVYEQAQPYAEQEQPVYEQAQPYAEQEQPVYEQAQPYAEQDQPASVTQQSQFSQKQPTHTQAPAKKSYNSYKRSAVRQFSSTISLMIMVPVFVLTALFLIVFPRSKESFIEKRNLTSFPEFTFENYFNGSFTGGINTWFTDTVPFRDDFKNMGNSFKGLFGISTEDSVTFVGDVKKVPKKVTKKTSSKTDETSEKTSETQESKVQESSKEEESSEPEQKDYRKIDAEWETENGVVVVKQDGHYRAMELFGGGDGVAYVDALNDLRTKLDSSIKIYSMIAPLSSQYYLPANYSDYSADQKEYVDDLSSRLNEGIVPIDIISVLKKHTEENIYCRTDHHWMPLGAYYAVREFAKAAGVDFKELDTFTPETIFGFVGTMYSFSGNDIRIKNDPEDFTYYVPDNYDKCEFDFYDTDFTYDYTGSYFKEVGDPQSNAYLTFFGGDEQIVKIRSDKKNGRRLIVIKDSYGNAEPGYLMNSFEEIYIVDMRYFDLNLVDFINQMKITDVLFTMVTYSAFGGNAENLSTLITQAQGQEIVDHYKDAQE